MKKFEYKVITIPTNISFSTKGYEKKKSLVLGMILVFIGLCFIAFAVTHPEASFPWSNRITYMLYGIYLWFSDLLMLLSKTFGLISILKNHKSRSTVR